MGVEPRTGFNDPNETPSINICLLRRQEIARIVFGLNIEGSALDNNAE